MHCHLRTDGLGGTVIADLEYPPRVAFVLLSTLLERFAVDITYVLQGMRGDVGKLVIHIPTRTSHSLTPSFSLPTNP